MLSRCSLHPSVPVFKNWCTHCLLFHPLVKRVILVANSLFRDQPLHILCTLKQILSRSSNLLVSFILTPTFDAILPTTRSQPIFGPEPDTTLHEGGHINGTPITNWSARSFSSSKASTEKNHPRELSRPCTPLLHVNGVCTELASGLGLVGQTCLSPTDCQRQLLPLASPLPCPQQNHFQHRARRPRAL